MTSTWLLIEQHIEKNWEAYTAGVISLGIAGICTMPEFIPGVPHDHWIQGWWQWLRNALQTAVPAARAAQLHPPPQNPPTGQLGPQNKP